MALPHFMTGGHQASQSFGAVRVLLILAQLITACGFFIALGGLAKLQKTANKLPLVEGGALTDAYTEVFQSAGITPYPLDSKMQFAYVWFLLFLELLILVWIATMCIFPATILRLKHSAGWMLTYVFVQFTLVVNSLVFFHKNAAANQVFGKKPITTTMAGVLIVLVCNGITLIMLGLIGTGSEFITPAHTVTGHNDVGARKMGPDVTHEAPVGTHQV